MAQTASTMLELGTIAPDFTLTDVVSGRMIRRDDFRGKKGLLVMFICAHCPFVKHIEKELGKLGQDYAPQNIGIVAISANDAENYPADNPEGLRKQAETFGFNFPIFTTNLSQLQSRMMPHVRLISISSMSNSSWCIAGSSIQAGPAIRFL